MIRLDRELDTFNNPLQHALAPWVISQGSQIIVFSKGDLKMAVPMSIEVTDVQLLYTKGGDKYHIEGCSTIQNSECLEYPRELLDDTEDERLLCDRCLISVLDAYAEYRAIKQIISEPDE